MSDEEPTIEDLTRIDWPEIEEDDGDDGEEPDPFKEYTNDTRCSWPTARYITLIRAGMPPIVVDTQKEGAD